MRKSSDKPQRTCVGCMERDCKQYMMRIAVSGEVLTLDEERRRPGRGAYLHYRNRCITGFGRNKARELRSLKRTIGPDQRRKLVELIHARLDSIAALE